MGKKNKYKKEEEKEKPGPSQPPTTTSAQPPSQQQQPQQQPQRPAGERNPQQQQPQSGGTGGAGGTWSKPQQGGRQSGWQQQQPRSDGGGRDGGTWSKPQQGGRQEQGGWQQQKQRGGESTQQQAHQQQQQQQQRQQFQQPPPQQQQQRQQFQQPPPQKQQQQQQQQRQQFQQPPPQQQQQQRQQFQQPPPQQQQQQRQQPGGSQSRTPSQSSTTSSLSTTSSSGIARGTVGTPGRVDTNYLRMNLDRMPAVAYHYDVTITPDRPKKFMRPAFEQFNRLHFKNIAMAYDGKKSFYTVLKLPCKECEKDVEIADSGARTISFKIAIKETDCPEIDLNSLRNYAKDRVYDKPMRAMQCLEVVLASPCHSRGVRAGRSFFTKPDRHYDLNDGYEMWTGIYQATILGDQLFLNVDISHKSFPSECLLTDYLKNNYRNVDPNFKRPLDPRRDLRELRAYLKMVNIVYEPPKSFNSLPRVYRVNEVSEKGASEIFFTMDDGKKLSVAEYFASRGFNLKYPNLNCLQVGSTVKANFLPLELCKIQPGQALNKKDGSRQVQQMIRYSATSTNERKDKIMRMLNYFQHNSDSIIQKFGLQIGANFIEVPMRLLQSPMLEYFSRETIRPMNGSWRMGDNTKFLQTKNPNSGHKWAIVYSKMSRNMNYNTINNLAMMLSKDSVKRNISLGKKPEIREYQNIDQTLRELKKEQYDLVIVVIPNFGTSYADIKQSAELTHGILTQCIKENTIERRLDNMLVLNLLLKLNAKLNGANHKIAASTHVDLQNVMYLGADVTHPSPDQRHIPSVVGVAASHDTNGACYNMQYRLQQSTVENIEDMSSIFLHHANVYKSYQNRYPDHIIYYRDGVSDGQFPIVKQYELGGIRAACSKLGIKPKITCIIVVKRHHTRFFPQTQGRDKFNNVPPGTVVDRVIVHPNEVQFFMVSHQSIQGTAKPTRYNVIEDDANMNIDLLQKLTYNLCHLFPRCNRVVSYPAPAYLAHLVAYRGRVYLEGENRFNDLRREYQKRLINADFMQRNPMYFV